MKLVSIAVGTYNGADHLEKQLDSLVNQTYPNKEIIVLDDSSTDNTLIILEKYRQDYSFFRYEQNNMNLGYVKNFEKLISLCQGEFIALCDQDDIWDENKITLQVENIGNAALIYHDSAFIDEQDNLLPGKLSDIYPFYTGSESYRFLFFNCIAGHSILFQRHLIPYLMPFPEKYFHDRWIALIASERGGIVFIKKQLVYYRQHTSSVTDTLNRRIPQAYESTTFFDRNKIEWIRHSYEKSVHHKSYFGDILSCFNSDNKIIRKFKLWRLLARHADTIFYNTKKRGLSRLNYIRKLCFITN